MQDSIIQKKTEDFAVSIVELYKLLTDGRKEYILSKQILRSGTSIGANIAEAEVSQSRKDFFHKCYIAYKELSETMYWLRLLLKTGYISQDIFNKYISDAEEIKRILGKIISTTRDKLNNKEG